jgi:hypothetical protein
VKYAKAAGVEFPHIIGKGAGHNYTADAKKEINEKIDAVVAKGLPAARKEIKFTTYTLRYNQCGGVVVTGLEKHWEKAEVTATVRDGKDFTVNAKGVTAITITSTSPSGSVTFGGIDGLMGWGSNDKTERPPTPHHYFLKDGKWTSGKPDGLRKAPGLQGPIDDAFMSAFIMVRPTGKPMNEKIGKWADMEMKHAVKHWRQQFRGDAPIKDDKDLTDDDIKNNNLILWGDAQSNATLGKMANKLPVTWVSKMVDGKVVTNVVLGGDEYDADSHMPALIFPNPLNPKKYVVLNSGFTYREYAYLNNARQVPVLPDYAVIDVTTPPDSRYPGKIVRAGFFDEQWKLQQDDGK